MSGPGVVIGVLCHQVYRLNGVPRAHHELLLEPA